MNKRARGGTGLRATVERRAGRLPGRARSLIGDTDTVRLRSLTIRYRKLDITRSRKHTRYSYDSIITVSKRMKRKRTRLTVGHSSSQSLSQSKPLAVTSCPLPVGQESESLLQLQA